MSLLSIYVEIVVGLVVLVAVFAPALSVMYICWDDEYSIGVILALYAVFIHGVTYLFIKREAYIWLGYSALFMVAALIACLLRYLYKRLVRNNRGDT